MIDERVVVAGDAERRYRVAEYLNRATLVGFDPDRRRDLG